MSKPMTPERRAKIEEYVAGNKGAVVINYPDTWTKVAGELLGEIDRLNTAALILDGLIADAARLAKIRVDRDDLINKAVSQAINTDFFEKLFDPRSPTGWPKEWTDREQRYIDDGDGDGGPLPECPECGAPLIFGQAHGPTCTLGRVEKLGEEMLKRYHPTLYRELVAEEEARRKET